MQALGMHLREGLVAVCDHTAFVLLSLCWGDPCFILLASFAHKTICKRKEGGYVESVPIISPGIWGFEGVFGGSAGAGLGSKGWLGKGRKLWAQWEAEVSQTSGVRGICRNVYILSASLLWVWWMDHSYQRISCFSKVTHCYFVCPDLITGFGMVEAWGPGNGEKGRLNHLAHHFAASPPSPRWVPDPVAPREPSQTRPLQSQGSPD